MLTFILLEIFDSKDCSIHGNNLQKNNPHLLLSKPTIIKTIHTICEYLINFSMQNV